MSKFCTNNPASFFFLLILIISTLLPLTSSTTTLPGDSPNQHNAHEPPTPTFQISDGSTIFDATTKVTVIGPFSYSELKKRVDSMKIRKRAIGGLYLCAGINFGKPCYYAIYPQWYYIHPDLYWVKRISSVGPDRGTVCSFSNTNNCAGTIQVYTYPGGNLRNGIENNLKCFFCWAGQTGADPTGADPTETVTGQGRRLPKETGSGNIEDVDVDYDHDDDDDDDE